MSLITKLLTDSEPLSPQAATGCLMIIAALFVWGSVSFWLAFSGATCAHYGEMTAGAVSIMSAGAGLLGYHLSQSSKGGESK